MSRGGSGIVCGISISRERNQISAEYSSDPLHHFISSSVLLSMCVSMVLVWEAWLLANYNYKVLSLLF